MAILARLAYPVTASELTMGRRCTVGITAIRKPVAVVVDGVRAAQFGGRRGSAVDGASAARFNPFAKSVAAAGRRPRRTRTRVSARHAATVSTADGVDASLAAAIPTGLRTVLLSVAVCRTAQAVLTRARLAHVVPAGVAAAAGTVTGAIVAVLLAVAHAVGVANKRRTRVGGLVAQLTGTGVGPGDAQAA